MRYTAVALLLFATLPVTACLPALGPTRAAVRVIDGDTLDIDGVRIRISNIDAPEMPPRARCAYERDLAIRATAQLRTLTKRGRVSYAGTGTDRYGRTLATVSVDGRDVGRLMIEREVARPWAGRREVWCTGLKGSGANSPPANLRSDRPWNMRRTAGERSSDFSAGFDCCESDALAHNARPKSAGVSAATAKPADAPKNTRAALPFAASDEGGPKACREED